MTDAPLTKKRAVWAKQRGHKGVFKGTTLRYNAAVRDRYVIALTSLTKQMTSQVRREIEKFFKTEHAQEYFAQDADTGSQARIITNQLMEKFDQLFNTKAKGLAETMARDSDKASSAALHSSLREMSGGLSLETTIISGALTTVMKASIAENVGLIKSIASEYLGNVQRAVLRSVTTGNGLEDLVPQLDKYEGISIRKARNIAIDQTRKTYNHMNKHRMQSSGVNEFEWIHSGGGQRPRQLHIQMSGNIYNFDNLPVIDDDGERGIPGQAINCGCTMRPIVRFNDGESKDDDGESGK